MRGGAADRVAAAPRGWDPDPDRDGALRDGDRRAEDWAAARGLPAAPEHATTITTDPQASRSITRFKAVDRPICECEARGMAKTPTWSDCRTPGSFSTRFPVNGACRAPYQAAAETGMADGCE